jgi:hypothetical protein
MKTYQKHHFAEWQDRDTLGGLGKIAIEEGAVHSNCTRCGVKVKIGRVGGTKFWIGGKWVSKRPPCVVPENGS